MGGVATCGVGSTCHSLTYDIGSGLSVRDDPCVKILCCKGILVVVNAFWISCGCHEVGELVLPLHCRFIFLFI